ncbi:Lrp/AsnC family transcriptional regulator [Enterococcus alishanensis]|uniref:Lrp/AsnC family transcriptional regulator n=1 Tax=Enterococcus alishanensis TaxID=1303817 RepID=A0ABS6TCS8_9ENTE|nr:Lrp/AsnC family transcriptional regulator [Enterococcus alishanensis]MBV7390724.1 Lrp/AsnC family transcriptional regulator [Enterococcus alishanensis]
METIDETDLKILKLLSTDSRMRIKDLSTAVKLSEPSVKRRIEKMVDAKILRAFTIDIDYSKLGYSIPFYVKISNLTISFTDFIKKAQQINPTLSFDSVTGEENYIIQGRAQTIVEIEKLLAALMHYGKVSTSIILEETAGKKIIDLM